MSAAPTPATMPAGVRLTDEQRLAWLRLIRSDGVGPATFRDLINHFGTAAAALDALPSLSARAGRRVRICTPAEATAEVEETLRLGGRMVAIGEPDYPPWLRHIDGAPPLISVRGSAGVLVRPMVAVVGARNASVNGRKFAAILARGLGDLGLAVVSGLARGIDAAAHQASLASGTVAVLAGGLDQLYPPEHLELAAEIVATGGAHLTEMPSGWSPRARDFPRRNRLVSGLALGVVVVEAADRSGSLITARLAADQGRQVFAVPGSPLDPRAAGTNRLLKDGAAVVTAVEDVWCALRPMLEMAPQAPAVIAERERTEISGDADDSERGRVLEALGPSPVEIDEVIRFTGLRPAVVHLVLIELDLAGRIERHPGNRVSLI